MNVTRCLHDALGLLTVCLFSTGTVLAQEGKPEEAQEAPEFVLPDLTGKQDDQAEMIRLFHEVERTLGAIDLELADAGAGRIPAPEGKDSGIDRLLRSHGDKSDQAVSGIEQILELAQKMGGRGGT